MAKKKKKTARKSGKAEPKTEPALATERAARKSQGGWFWLLVVILCIAAVLETLGFVSSGQSFAARALAGQSQNADAAEFAERGLQLDSHNSEALYLAANLARGRGDTEAFEALEPKLLAVYPSQSAVQRLAAEMAFRQQDFEHASELFWLSLSINPTPPSSPANFWRMTALASEKSGRSDDALAAAWRASVLADHDPLLSAEQRTALLRDIGAVFQRNGLPIVASHFETRSRVANPSR